MVEGVSALTKLRHENILPLVGITTQFDSRVSLVSKWMDNGNARKYVQNVDVDPSALVCTWEHIPFLDENTTKMFVLMKHVHW